MATTTTETHWTERVRRPEPGEARNLLRELRVSVEA